MFCFWCCLQPTKKHPSDNPPDAGTQHKDDSGDGHHGNPEGDDSSEEGGDNEEDEEPPKPKPEVSKALAYLPQHKVQFAHKQPCRLQPWHHTKTASNGVAAGAIEEGPVAKSKLSRQAKRMQTSLPDLVPAVVQARMFGMLQVFAPF